MNRGVCAVCDKFVSRKDTLFCPLSQDFLIRCRMRLKPSLEVTQSLRKQYDISNIVQFLGNVLLSKRCEIVNEGNLKKFEFVKDTTHLYCEGEMTKTGILLSIQLQMDLQLVNCLSVLQIIRFLSIDFVLCLL